MGIKIDPHSFFNITLFLLEREVPVFNCEGLLLAILEILFTPNEIRASSFSLQINYDICVDKVARNAMMFYIKNMLQVS